MVLGQSTPKAYLHHSAPLYGFQVMTRHADSVIHCSTVANDKNESDVICQQAKHLGRKKGNAMLGIFQKVYSTILI